MQEIILYSVIFLNIITFLLYGLDKQKARQRRWRIPERVLIGFALIGGSVGAYAGMKVFRHKTQKKKFSIGVPLIFLIQIGLLFYFYGMK